MKIHKKEIIFTIVFIITIACTSCGKKEDGTIINKNETIQSNELKQECIVIDTKNTLEDNIIIDDTQPWDETLDNGMPGNGIRLIFEKDVKIIIRTGVHGSVAIPISAFADSPAYYDTYNNELVIPSFHEHVSSLELNYIDLSWTPKHKINLDYECEPYMAITVFEEGSIVGAALIGVEERKENDGKINEYVVLKNSVIFPKQNGEYQKVSGEYLNEYFDIKFDGFGDVKKENSDKVKIPEENINVGNKVDYAVYDESSDINSIHFSYNEKTKMNIEVDGGKVYISEIKQEELTHEKYECAPGEIMEFDFKEGIYVKFHPNNPEKVVLADDCKNKSLDKRCETVYWDGFYDYIDENGNLKEGVDLSDKKHYMKVVIKEEDNIIGAALIKMEYKLIDEQWTASIHTEKSIEYPKENGEYQNITQEMVEEYFGAE